MSNRIVIGSAALLWAVTSAAGQYDATTHAPQDVTLAFTVPGRVATLRVPVGAKVEAGQVLAELDDTEQRARVELRRLAAGSDVALRLATQRLALATIEGKRARRKDAKSLESIAAQAARDLANLELEQSQLQMDQARLELRLAEARLEQFTLRAPFDGTVERIDLAPGQAVDPQRPILRLIRSEELWIDANVPTERTHDLQTGASAWVTSKGVGDTAPIEGRIESLSSVIDPKTDTRRVRVKIANSDGLLVGAHVTVAFAPPGAAHALGGDSQPQPVAIADRVSSTASDRGSPRRAALDGSGPDPSAVP
jgi:RND family efflux transporter MFP subunit